MCKATSGVSPSRKEVYRWSCKFLGKWATIASGVHAGEMGEEEKGNGSISPAGCCGWGGVVSQGEQAAISHHPPLSAHLPWRTPRELSQTPASPSFRPPLYPRPSTSRQIPADSLFQTRPRSTQRWEPRDLTFGQMSMIGTSTRPVPQRSLLLLLLISSPKLSSTPRRG